MRNEPKARIGLLAVSVALLLAGSGCAKYYVETSLTDRSFRPKGESIAVISGTKEQQNVYLAALVADSLRSMSRFQVMAPEHVAKVLALYPLTVKGPYRSAYLSLDTDWGLSDRKKIAEIQRALGVDYLYVIWAPISVQHNHSDKVMVPGVAQLFEHPNAKEVAETELKIIVGGKDSPTVKEGVAEVARQLAERTHMAVVAQK
jgi:hypothetical protein